MSVFSSVLATAYLMLCSTGTCVRQLYEMGELDEKLRVVSRSLVLEEDEEDDDELDRGIKVRHATSQLTEGRGVGRAKRCVRLHITC